MNFSIGDWLRHPRVRRWTASFLRTARNPIVGLSLVGVIVVIIAMTQVAFVVVDHWSERDIELRSSLVFRSIHDSVVRGLEDRAHVQARTLFRGAGRGRAHSRARLLRREGRAAPHDQGHAEVGQMPGERLGARRHLLPHHLSGPARQRRRISAFRERRRRPIAGAARSHLHPAARPRGGALYGAGAGRGRGGARAARRGRRLRADARLDQRLPLGGRQSRARRRRTASRRTAYRTRHRIAALRTQARAHLCERHLCRVVAGHVASIAGRGVARRGGYGRLQPRALHP